MNDTEGIILTIPPQPKRSHFGDVKLKPYTFWLPDTEDPVVRETLERRSAAAAAAIEKSKAEQKQYLALRDDPEEKEWDRWCEAAFAETMKDEPPYDWGDNEP